MTGRRSGRGLMTAGMIVSLVGVGIVLVKTLEIPRHWVPLLVGLLIFLAGAICWATSRSE